MKHNLLDERFLYHLQLDEEQQIFRDSILDDNKLIIFCDAKAGTGKTTIATACAQYLYDTNPKKYDGIVYIAAPTQEQKQGFMKGTLEEKSDPYFTPFYEALEEISVNMHTAFYSNIDSRKRGEGYIQCLTHTFMRGTNFKNKIVIIDEAQNFYVDELRKVLTRIHDSCKTIVIGHTGQIDLYHNPERSGFGGYMKWFAGDDRTAICYLTTNHRGWISTRADDYPGNE